MARFLALPAEMRLRKKIRARGVPHNKESPADIGTGTNSFEDSSAAPFMATNFTRTALTKYDAGRREWRGPDLYHPDTQSSLETETNKHSI
jgi:hypothetical protein